MALQAEALVEEWLSKNGYFTIRGIKDKLDEISFLAVRYHEETGWQHVHCEVQVSVRPVTYISKLTKSQMEKLGVKSKTSSKLRNSDSLKTSVKAWTEIKFTSDKKRKIRDSLVPGVEWEYWFVHGKVKDENELEHIQNSSVKLIPIQTVLNELIQNDTTLSYGTSSARELVDLIKLLNQSPSE